MAKHEVTVGYTNEDDGVNLFCKCGWEKVFGDRPFVDTLAHEAMVHECMSVYEESKRAKCRDAPQAGAEGPAKEPGVPQVPPPGGGQ